jgi:hypothetical protein
VWTIPHVFLVHIAEHRSYSDVISFSNYTSSVANMCRKIFIQLSTFVVDCHIEKEEKKLFHLTFRNTQSIEAPQKYIPVRMNKSRMLDCIVLQCGYHYLSMFLTIYQPPDLTTEPAIWHFNNTLHLNPIPETSGTTPEFSQNIS